MTLSSRKEYLPQMIKRYKATKKRSEKTRIIDEIIAVVGYQRKYAINILNGNKKTGIKKTRRKRISKYASALPAILLAWEALDYPCAERLHPVLPQTVANLEKHGEIQLCKEVRQLLSVISRPTLSRLLSKSRPIKKKRMSPPRKKTKLEAQVPVERYSSGEMRPGALEIDLVEHNGGSALGHFAYTLSVVDVATGYSRRRSVLGKGQLGVHRELSMLVANWPYPIWAIHTDNGTEFLNSHLISFCKAKGLHFTRSRPYKKNDNPHVEQKNFQHVRCLVGYERFDTPQEVDWLNNVYDLYDPYVNLFQPVQKLISKQRNGSKVSKCYDIAKTPLQRAILAGVVPEESVRNINNQYHILNPLALHRQIQKLVTSSSNKSENAAPSNTPSIAAN